MQDPRKFPKTLNITFVIVTVLNLAFATICYMLFGDKTAGIVVSVRSFG
jgi:amino acid permease